MSDPKVFIFAPVDQADECHQKLEKFGCELSMGQAGWHSPQGDNEQDMIKMAQEMQTQLLLWGNYPLVKLKYQAVYQDSIVTG